MALTLRTILILLKLPFNLILVALKAWLFGGKYRKYPNQILHQIRLFICETVLSLPTNDCAYIGVSNTTLIRLMGRKNKDLTANFPSYNERYDKNSIWIVKHKNMKKSDPIMIYLHGGGYFVQTSPSQVESLISIYKLASDKVQSKMSVLFLDYKLASNGYHVPYQLGQYHETYARLVSEGYTNIIPFGDSAGGHLAITHLQKLKQLNFKVFPKKVILISPWVKLLPDVNQFEPGNSYYDNQGKDIIDFSGFSDRKLIKNITGENSLNDLLVSPGNKMPHDRNDWVGIPTLNDPGYEVFVLAGEDEVFRDDIINWMDYALDIDVFKKTKFGESNNQYNKYIHEYVSNDKSKAHIRAYIEPWGVHDPILLLEHDILDELKKNPNLQAEDVDPVKYFGISRLVTFLNETIE